MTSTVAFESFGSNGTVVIRNSLGGLVVSDDVNKLLHFLRYSASGLKVTWDLDEFAAPILRLLPEDVLTKLSRFDDNLAYGGAELYYLAQRQFRVGKSRYYGIRDFWGARTDEKPTLGAVQSQADDLITTLYRIGLGRANQQPIRKLTSAIAVFEDSEWGDRVYRSLPTIYDLPEDVQEATVFASKADGREWVCNHQIGGFKQGEIFDYDRAAAYAYEASQLPDTRDLTWWKASKLGSREILATLGAVQGSFTLDATAEFAHASPVMLKRAGNELPCLPLGELPVDYYTMDEVRHVLENKLGTFKLKEGWFAEPAQGAEVRYPLRDLMGQLYSYRGVSELAGRVAKAISNSLVGKMVETRATGELGQLRNDIWHCHVLARNRIAVSRFLIENEVKAEQVVCVQTDGVKLTVDISCPSNGMGSWVNKGSSGTIVVSPYKVYSQQTRPYQMTYSDLESMIGEHPLSQRYSRSSPHRITLIQAIRNYEDITRVGEVIDSPTSIELVALEAEQNRVYPKLPRTGRALLANQYQSQPVLL